MRKPQGRLALSILGAALVIALVSLSLSAGMAQVATGDFSVALSRTSIAIPQGSSGTVSLYVTSLNSFAQTVSLTYDAPSSITASFNDNGPSQITTFAAGTSAASVTIFVDGSVSTGMYPFSITGISPTGITHKAALYVTVVPAGTVVSTSVPAPDFITQPAPAVMTLTPGTSESSTLVFSSVNGFSSSLSLSEAWSGITPSGVAVSLLSPVTVLPGGSASSILTLTAGSSPSTGSFTLIVTATNGAISHSTAIQVTITGTPTVFAPASPDFSITSTVTPPSPTVVWLTAGQSQSVTIVLSSVDGFSSSVSLTAAWNGVAPSGVGVSLPNHVAVPAGGSAASTLTLTTSSAPSGGTYMLWVTASNGVVSHFTQIFVIIS